MTSAATSAVTAAGGGTCPKRAAYADGCPGAQAGAPNYPTMLDTYGANRPPWNVAGVDYRVGADNGPFKDPSVAANLPACASYVAGSQNWVRVDSVPCTIDHFDFTLHNCIGLQPIGINNPSGTVTVTNNKFCAGTSWQPAGNGLFNSNSAINHVIRYNTFDEAYNDNTGSVISLLVANSTATIEYNLFLRSHQAVTNTTGTGTITIRYNAAKGLGSGGTHGDWFITNNNSTPLTINESFNLVNSDETSCCATAHCYMAMGAPGNQKVSCTNDTYISAISTAADGPLATARCRCSFGSKATPATALSPSRITTSMIPVPSLELCPDR